MDFITPESTKNTKKQLLISSVVIVALLLIYTLLNQNIINSERNLNALLKKSLETENQLLMIRRHEKDFMSRLDEKYIQRLSAVKIKLDIHIGEIAQSIIENNLQVNFEEEYIYDSLAKYELTFKKYSNTLLNMSPPDSKKFSDLEKIIWLNISNQQTKQLEIETKILEAQANIHDFLFYQESRYYEDFLSNINSAQELLQNEPAKNKILLNLINEYKQEFGSLYRSLTILGMDQNSGLHKELRKSAHAIEEVLNVLTTELPSAINKKLDSMVFFSNTLIAFLFTLLILILVLLTRSLTHIERELVESSNDAQKANLAKSAFLANMSHEIRTPLNGIIGMAEILNESKLGVTERDHLSTILSSSQTLLMLINDILDLSKIESGKLAITINSMNIREVAYDSIDLVSSKAIDNNINLLIEIDEQIAERVNADEHRIRQVLMNLLSNAVKFTKDGKVKLIIKQTKSTDDEVCLYFAVQDSGIGIEKSKQASIMDPFTQEDGSITREFGGTGLGLSISNKLVDLMGGKLQIESEKGVGSRFYFSLDLTIATQKPAVISQLQGQQYSLLFHDDENRLTVANSLHYYSLPIVDLENANKDINVIYQYKDGDSLKEVVRELSISHAQANLLLCINFKQNKLDLSDIIDGLIKLPLLGIRLINTLTYALDHKKTKAPVLHSETDEISTQLSTPATEKKYTKGKILVVEDNLVNQKVATLFLNKLNYEVNIANNGQEAIDLFTIDNGYDAILMDCMMPIIDGFEATKALRNYEESAQLVKTPIIALTASVLDQDIQKCYQVGMDDYLSKPIQKDNLINMLNKHITNDLNL
jgi:signal transduction histidine kinase/ActR/RegA family two-component response regulator